MARGFGTTFGVGATDVVTSGVFSGNPTLRSWFCWYYQHLDGGGALGRIWDQINGQNAFLSNVSGQGGNMAFNALFSTAAGVWTIAKPLYNAWHSLGVSYDGSLAANNPIIFVDGVSVTVTRSVAPVGSPTWNGNAGPLLIGNRTPTPNRNWDGKIAEFAVWDGVLLTAGEFVALSQGIRAYRIRRASLVWYPPLDGLQSPEPDLSGKALNGTVTGTAKQPGPPVNLLSPQKPQISDTGLLYTLMARN